MSFPKYPEYKDSGVEWLGKVPAHWVVGPLRWYATIQGGVAKGKTFSDDTPTIDLPYLRVANVQDGHVDLSSVNTVTVALSEVDRYRLQPGDVLMNEGGDNDKLGRGTVWQGEIADCLHQNHVFAIRPNQYLLPYWLCMFTRSGAARSYFYLYSKQSTNLASISSSNVMSCPLPLPPKEEQLQVLSFLDHETARIDALVEEQQRLIELLKEKRQAVISHAVTKGLDPDVPMKDSGVEWLGEVPAHWEVVRVEHSAKLESGHTPNKDIPEYWDGDIPWVSLNDSKQLASSDYIHKTKFTISALGIANSSVRLLPAGAVVFTRDATIGLSAITGNEMAVSQHLIAWLCRDEVVIPEYLLLVFYTMKEELDRYTFGATIKTIGMPDIRSLVMPLPPVSEQMLVIRHVYSQREKLDRLIAEAEMASHLLLERRSALISAAVTGKIDVRGWQADQQSRQPDVLMTAKERASYGVGREAGNEV